MRLEYVQALWCIQRDIHPAVRLTQQVRGGLLAAVSLIVFLIYIQPKQ